MKLELIKTSSFYSQAAFRTLEDVTICDYLVPKGTVTDGATLPRWVIFLALILLFTPLFWIGWIALLVAYTFPAFGVYTLAAVLHDYMLENETELSRKEIDKKMQGCLEKIGVDNYFKVLMYRLVRINSIIAIKINEIKK